MFSNFSRLLLLLFCSTIKADGSNTSTAASYSSGVPIATKASGSGTNTFVPSSTHPPISTISSAGVTIESTSPPCPQIQHVFTNKGDEDISHARAEAVKRAFLRSWNQYAKNCFGRDTVVATTNACVDDFGGWGVTIFDALDTALIMNLTSVVKVQLAHIASVDFKTVPSGNPEINAFETTIRHLGGMLSAYDLIKNEYVGLYNPRHVEALLAHAVTLAKKLNVRFKTPSGLPAGNVNFATSSYIADSFTNPLNGRTYETSNAAICGTTILEYYRLSDLTNDKRYRDVIDKSIAYLVQPYPKPAFPYLVGSTLDLDTGNYLTYDYGWKAGIDSFYEYLIKAQIYDPSSKIANSYGAFWSQMVTSTYKNIAVSPYRWPDLVFLTEGDITGAKTYSMDDYACFAGGNILYGAKYHQDIQSPAPGSPTWDQIAKLGTSVIDSCNHLYETTKTGLGPLAWSWFNNSNHTYDPNAQNDVGSRISQSERGYFITAAPYNSFPETIESIFYGWRMTGQEKYRESNWEIFQSLMRQSNVPGNPYAGIQDVDETTTVFLDYLPSFYFAEVLKYLYLTFTDPEYISLDEWVFNTEAHPLRIKDNCSN